jgi:hypothetical protein
MTLFACLKLLDPGFLIFPIFENGRFITVFLSNNGKRVESFLFDPCYNSVEVSKNYGQIIINFLKWLIRDENSSTSMKSIMKRVSIPLCSRKESPLFILHLIEKMALTPEFALQESKKNYLSKTPILDSKILSDMKKKWDKKLSQ